MPQSTILQCPGCSRLLNFASDQTTMITCDSCTAVVKRTNGILPLEPRLIVLHNTEIIQPGTTGLWENQSFSVLGRFRAWFEESLFNYWTIQFSNRQIAWLGEGYGIYSILKPVSIDKRLSSAEVAGM